MSKSKRPDFIIKTEKRFKKRLPQILAEIEVYEQHLSQGTLSTNPTPAPQFK